MLNNVKKDCLKACAVLVSIIMIFSLCGCKKKNRVSNLGEINSNEDLKAIISKVYTGVDKSRLPNTEIINLDLNDKEKVKLYTGLDNGDNLEFAIVSKPLSEDEPFEVVLASVKDNVDVFKVSKSMNDNVNLKRWKTTEAEKVCSASSGNIICLVMANDATAKSIFESFKNLAGDAENDLIRTVYA